MNMWTVRYYQQGVPYEMEGDTKREVLMEAGLLQQAGRLSMYQLISPSGEVDMDQAQLDAFLRNDEELKHTILL